MSYNLSITSQRVVQMKIVNVLCKLNRDVDVLYV